MSNVNDPFRLSQAPRPLPLTMRLSNWFNVATQVALVWTLFSTPFFWLFCGNADLSGLTMRDAAATNGKVSEVRETGASENESTIYEIHYRYSVDGERYSGISYVTGSAPSPDAVVTVLYDEDDPGRSKIEGLRRKMFGPAVLFVTIFPAIGVIGLWFTVKWGHGRNRLLSHGLVADGKLVSQQPTGTTINERPLMALTFRYTARDGKPYNAVVKTVETKWLTDDEVEPILYDPDVPEKALGLDELDPPPDFDESGRMRGSVKRAALRSILPAITLLLNVWFFQRWLT